MRFMLTWEVTSCESLVTYRRIHRFLDTLHSSTFLACGPNTDHYRCIFYNYDICQRSLPVKTMINEITQQYNTEKREDVPNLFKLKYSFFISHLNT